VYLPTYKEGTCGFHMSTGYIIGGTITKRGEMPFIAALGYSQVPGKINYGCGGTLINK
jgi:hypothetical protein